MKHFLSCRKTSYSKLLKIVVLWVYLDLNQGLTRYQRVTLPPELYTHHQKTIDSFTYANIQEIAVCLLNILKMQMYNDCSCGDGSYCAYSHLYPYAVLVLCLAASATIYMVSYAVNIRHQALVELALPESHHVEVSTMRFLRRWESNPI